MLGGPLLLNRAESGNVPIPPTAQAHILGPSALKLCLYGRRVRGILALYDQSRRMLNWPAAIRPFPLATQARLSTTAISCCKSLWPVAVTVDGGVVADGACTVDGAVVADGACTG